MINRNKRFRARVSAASAVERGGGGVNKHIVYDKAGVAHEGAAHHCIIEAFDIL